MDIQISLLFFSVLLLFIFMIPGFLLRKAKFASDEFSKSLSLYVLYIGQSAMLLHGFIAPFDKAVIVKLAWIFLLAFVTHTIFYLLSCVFFRNAPEKMRRSLRFGIIFSNAGYMGIPVLTSTFGQEFAIYATIYVVWFNIFAFTLGRLIYTNDKKYMSIQQALINPAVIPIMIGLVIYVSGLGGVICNAMQSESFGSQTVATLYKALTFFKDTVSPVSMIVIGVRLADINFKGIFKDRHLYPFLLIRLILFPVIVWCITKALNLLGWLPKDMMCVLLVLSSTPAAAYTTIFAELFDGDAPYAGKLVATSTILSVVTMPLVALLLKL